MTRKMMIISICLALGLASIWIFWKLLQRTQNQQRQPAVASLVTPLSAEGFTRADKPIPINFPGDEGAHPDYQTEWWYYTGNLESSQGNHYGYQLTFFRRALQPPDKTATRASDFAADQVYMAHFALTDVNGISYRSFERLQRGAANLAGVTSDPFKAWLDDWQIEQTGPGTYHLHAAQDNLVLNLDLTDVKGPILQGDQGYSQKGAEPGNASYYYSLPRIETKGMVQIGDLQETVNGLSWMDHEWSTSALSQDQVGWDWFSIQLDDNSEIMVFKLRKDDGSVDPFSSGIFISPDGSTSRLKKDDFEIQVLDQWTSPHTKAAYPSHWRLNIPTLGLSLDIKPFLADQELQTSYNYWEGAVQVSGERDGKPLTGNGYVELTGYAGSFSGQF